MSMPVEGCQGYDTVLGTASVGGATEMPVEVCQGYDTVLGSGRSTAMCGKTVSVGGAAEMHYKVCETMEEVSSTLQIDHSLSFLSLAGLGLRRCSPKLHFLNSLKLTTHSVAIVVYAKVISGGYTITNASLAVAAPQNEKEVEEFVMVYGDSYVTKVVTGAEYYASFTYNATTKEEKMDLMARMHLEGLFAWETCIDKQKTFRDVQMEFHQAVTGMTGMALPEPCNMLDFVLKFPTLTINMPQTLHFESMGYEHAPGFNASLFCPIRRNRFLLAENPHFLSCLQQVKGLENDLQATETMLSRYGMYKGSVGAFLDEAKGAIKDDRATVQSMMQAYRDNRMKEVSHPLKFKSLDYGKTIQSSYWTEMETMYQGGHGGGVRDYVTNVREFITSGRKISSIQLRSGGLIDRINIKYNNGDVFEWGGTHTSTSNILYVPEGVYFSKIRIQDQGNRITYLEFVLTNGNSLSAGYEDKSKNDIIYEPYSPPDYLYFCGFQLRSGISIDGLRPIFAKFVI